MKIETEDSRSKEEGARGLSEMLLQAPLKLRAYRNGNIPETQKREKGGGRS